MSRRHASGSSKRKGKHGSPLFDSKSSIMMQLRRAYFALGAENAVRYGVNYDRILHHLWGARHGNGSGHVPIRAIAHLDDLIQAAACIDHVSIAWTDLFDVGEPALVRVCQRRLESADAVVFVRRMLSELKVNSDRRPERGLLTLQSYVGVQPLRNWLAERAAGRMGQMAVRAVQDRRPFGRRLALRAESAHIGRVIGRGALTLRFPLIGDVPLDPAVEPSRPGLQVREQEA